MATRKNKARATKKSEPYPQEYKGVNDTKYPSGIICDKVKLEEKSLYLVIIDIDNKDDSNPDVISMDDLNLVFKYYMDITYTNVTPSNGYHIYLLSETRPTSRHLNINIDYLCNGLYAVADYRFNLESGEREDYIKRDGSPEEVLIVETC